MGKADSWYGAEMVRYTILLKKPATFAYQSYLKCLQLDIFSTIGGNLLQSRVWRLQDQGISRFGALWKSISSTAIGVFSVCFHFYTLELLLLYYLSCLCSHDKTLWQKPFRGKALNLAHIYRLPSIILCESQEQESRQLVTLHLWSRNS